MSGFRLRFLDRAVTLAPGELVIGRAPTAHIRIDQSMVSRRHARVRTDADGVVIEDLGSRNGVLVNGELLRGPRRLVDGDAVRIGEVDFTVQAARSEADGRALLPPVRIEVAGGAGTEPDVQVTTAPSALLLEMADKSLSLGRADDAEWILVKLGNDIDTRLSAGQRLAPETLERMSTSAIALALAREKGTWIDWIFSAHHEAGRVLSPALIDTLHAAIRKLRHPASGAMSAYVEAMRESASGLGPSERFLVGRLEGLLEVAARNPG